MNATELVAALICEKETILEGIQYVQERVDGSDDAASDDRERNLSQRETAMEEHLW